MSTLILPRSIARSNADDHATVDQFHDDQAYHARAVEEGIARTTRLIRGAPAPEWDGQTDELAVVRMPGHERIVHIRKDRNAPGGRKIRVYLMTPRPCPGCGRYLYGMGEVESIGPTGQGVPWHLACWELEQAAQMMGLGVLAELEFDEQGLVKAPPAKGYARRPRRGRR